MFTGVGTTGLSFNIPQNIKEKENFKLINITGGQINESTLSPDKLHSVYTGINIIEPSSGSYDQLINISGTQLTGVEFLFRSAWSGETNQYVPAREKTFVGGTGAYIKVPREIINYPITISGDGVLQESEQVFSVLPSISGIETKNLIVGQAFRITGINASESAAMLGVTGISSSRNDSGIRFISHNSSVNAQRRYDLSTASKNVNSFGQQQGRGKSDLGIVDYFGYDIGMDKSTITGLDISGSRTGVTIITGIINNSFLGEGFPFLIPSNTIIHQDYGVDSSAAGTYGSSVTNIFNKKILQIEKFSSRFITSSMHGLVTSVTGDSIEISGRRPETSGLSSNAINVGALLGISGRFFQNVTGVKIEGASATCLFGTGDWVSGVRSQNPFNCNLSIDYINYIGINACTGITSGNATLTLLDYHDLI